MNKVCVIGVYFGKLPNYFSLWRKSCKRNLDIDFILFTDNKLQNDENIKFHYMTLKDMQIKASKILGFRVSLNKAYKCCDYKPLYGLIFGEYIKNYDYWGHCDFDLIFGDLSYFFNKYKLYQYDKFLPLGHLSLYKNSHEVFNNIKNTGARVNYKTAYTNDKNYAFDEWGGVIPIYLKNKFPFFKSRIFVDIASIYSRYRIIEDYELDSKPNNYKYQIFYWENGKTYRAYYYKKQFYKEEYIYIHFKKRPNFNVDFDYVNATAFYITNKGFFEKKGEVTLDIIKKYNKYPGCLSEFFEKVKFNIKDLFKKIRCKL